MASSANARNSRFKERFLRRFSTREPAIHVLPPQPEEQPQSSREPPWRLLQEPLSGSVVQEAISCPHLPVPTDVSRSPSSASTHGSFFSNSQGFVINKSTFISATSSIPPSPLSNSVAFDLLKVRIATSAMHNSSERFDPPKCDEDTRVGLLEEIMSWANDPSSMSQIACITGPAGSGKSAIEQTVAEMCAAQNILAGSFFFSAGDRNRNTHHTLFTTLIYQIAQTNKDLRPFIEKALKDDAAIYDKMPEAQVNLLLIDTLQAANAFYTQGSAQRSTKKWPSVIIIDGIDECTGEAQQSHLLQIISKCFIQRKLPYKFIIASRPEYAMRKALETDLRMAYHIKLHEYSASSDIMLYLHRRLRALGEASSDPRASDPSWPTVPIVKKLEDNSSGQFVYAATAVKFASSRRASPFLRIQMILTWEPGVEQRKNPFAALDALYHNILMTAETAYQEDSEDGRSVIDLLREMMLYNRASGLVEMDFSISEFETFLQLRVGQIEDMLSDLHSLIKSTTDDSDGTPKVQITFHHKSFMDYLEDPARCSTAIHRPDYLMYTRLLRSSLNWLKLVNYDVLKVACQGESPETTCDLTEEQLQIVRFSLCYWTVYLFKSLIMDFNPGNGQNQQLSDSLQEFFASNGWATLKTFIRSDGLFRSSLKEEYGEFQKDVLEKIWSWYLHQCIDLDALPKHQQEELVDMVGCLQYYENRTVTAATHFNRVQRPKILPSDHHSPLDPPPPRSIVLSLPPQLNTLTRIPRVIDASGGWLGSRPLVSEPNVEDNPGDSIVSLCYFSESSEASSRRDSEYFSCSSQFGPEA